MQFISDDNDFSDTAVVHCSDARPKLEVAPSDEPERRVRGPLRDRTRGFRRRFPVCLARVDEGTLVGDHYMNVNSDQP